MSIAVSLFEVNSKRLARLLLLVFAFLYKLPVFMVLEPWKIAWLQKAKCPSFSRQGMGKLCPKVDFHALNCVKGD